MTPFDAIEFINLPSDTFEEQKECAKIEVEGPEDCIEAIKYGRDYLAKII